MPEDVVVVHCARGDTRPSTPAANEATAESIFVVVAVVYYYARGGGTVVKRKPGERLWRQCARGTHRTKIMPHNEYYTIFRLNGNRKLSRTIPDTLLFEMKAILIVFMFYTARSLSVGNLEQTLDSCCNVGKTWSVQEKSCDINPSFLLFNVTTEYNTMCTSTAGACCLYSLRNMLCDSGKQVGLQNGICNSRTQLEQNQVDFTMCCDLCKTGIFVGKTKMSCDSKPWFFSQKWGEVYDSCCRTAITESESKLWDINKKHDINQCFDGTHNCSSNEECKVTKNGFECHSRQFSPVRKTSALAFLTKPPTKQSCDVGYAYDVYLQKCKDIDECKLEPCEVNQLCVNTIGSFKCSCKNGFQLDPITNVCTDINECQQNLHTCYASQRCDNTIGSYQCIRFTGCGTGYTLEVDSALCIDDDECLLKTDNCGVLGPNWVCRNTIGSFRCEKKRCTGPNCKSQGDSKNTNQSSVICPRGFKTDRNNKCIDINECELPNRCLQNESCVNTSGSYYCLPKTRKYRN